jgi:hypothetical protein
MNEKRFVALPWTAKAVLVVVLVYVVVEVTASRLGLARVFDPRTVSGVRITSRLTKVHRDTVRGAAKPLLPSDGWAVPGRRADDAGLVFRLMLFAETQIVARVFSGTGR